MKIGVFVKSSYAKAGIGRFLESLEIPFYSDATNTIDFIYFNNLSEHNDTQYDVAIYGGCLPEELELSTVSSNKFYTFCSPFGQADLSSQDFYSAETVILANVLNLLGTEAIKGVITQSKSLATRFGFIYIPPIKRINTVEVEFSFDRQYYSMIGNNLRKHRNVVNQLAAVSLLNPREPIVVSRPELYKHYSNIFNCRFASQDLTEDSAYMSSIARHKLAFQCSFSEAFSYIAYEYAIQGVPCICSPAIDWYPIKECVVSNPDSWQEIYIKAQSLLSDEGLYRECSHKLSEFALKMAQRNSEWLKEVVYENFIKLSK